MAGDVFPWMRDRNTYMCSTADIPLYNPMDHIRTTYTDRLLSEAKATCSFCGNNSGLKDKRGNCISCGGPC